MLGKKAEQIRDGIRKTESSLYTAPGCNRDNFANSILVTRKLNGKSYSRLKPNTILAHKMSISFHPKDNPDYQTVFNIAKEFAEHFIYSKGYEVLFAVHIDREHIHAHLLISNCNIETGKSYRRSQRDLYEMSVFFGQQCLEHGYVNSVRENFYNHDLERQLDKETFAEKQMKSRGAETFKDELREVIEIEIADKNNHTFNDVINALKLHYNVECRVAGNTVSYRHPEYKDRNGKPVSVRGSRLGELYTRKGIEYELSKKYSKSNEFERVEAGLREFVEEGHDASGGRTTIGRGQVSGVTAACDYEKAMQDFDLLYERYRKRASEDERRTIEASERARAVQKRNSGRGR